MGGVGKITITIVEAIPTTEPPKHIWWPPTVWLLKAMDWLKTKRLENVAIANALQLEAPEPCQLFPAFITTPFQVGRRWTYPLPYYSVFCCWYITLRRDLDLWPCDLDLWPLTLNSCSVSSVTWWNSTKFERNRTIHSEWHIFQNSKCYQLSPEPLSCI